MMKFKISMIAGFALLLAVFSFAQQAPPFQGPPRAQFDPFTAVQTALNLSAAQVESARTLLKAEETDSQPLMADLRTKQEALRTLQRSGSANSTDLGNALAAVQAAEVKLKAVHDRFVASFENLLTSDQKQIVADTRAAAERIPALARIGLIQGGPGGPGGPGFGGPGGGPGAPGGRGPGFGGRGGPR